MSHVFCAPNRSANACPLCATSELRTNVVQDYTGPGTLSIVECDPCGIAWQWPVAWDLAKGTAFFDENYKESTSSSTSYFDTDQRRSVAALQMDFVEATCNSPDTLLDVGAGIGTFVKEAVSRGWDAMGLDLSRIAGEVAREAGVAVSQGTIESLPNIPTFRSITMWDVIEHVDDPFKLVCAAFERLQPGGWLFVETGNYQSASRAATGPDWWLWQGDHRWYFSPPSLNALLKNAGFSLPVLASTTFRPEFRADREPKSSIKTLLKALLRQPFSARRAVERHFAIRDTRPRWPEWAQLPIFAIAAQKGFEETASATQGAVRNHN